MSDGLDELRKLVTLEAMWPDGTWRDAARKALAEDSEKDIVIKALAEVLNKCRTQARGTNLEDEIVAALRLAGRL